MWFCWVITTVFLKQYKKVQSWMGILTYVSISGIRTCHYRPSTALLAMTGMNVGNFRVLFPLP